MAYEMGLSFAFLRHTQITPINICIKERCILRIGNYYFKSLFIKRIALVIHTKMV